MWTAEYPRPPQAGRFEMTQRADETPKATTRRFVRRRTIVALAAFLVVSAALHFTLGPAMTAISPRWDVTKVADQAISIVTISKRDAAEPTPRPTPTPTPPPVKLPKTARRLALLQLREMGADERMHTVLPIAHRTSMIVLEKRVAFHERPASPTGPVVAVAMPPTPVPSAAPGDARTATANSGDVSGSMVWGDDNPPRIIKTAAVASTGTGNGVARVAVSVAPDGSVTDVELVQSSGDPAFDQAALAAARGSSFAPATLNGMPVHGTCIVDFPIASDPTT
jgi:TonB family protein